MLNFQRQSSRTTQMNLKHFIFTVGLLVSLAAFGTKAQTGNSDTKAYPSSLATSTHMNEGETSTVPASLTSLSPVDPALRYCNETKNYTYLVGCQQCDKGVYEPCRTGDLIVRKQSCQLVVDGFVSKTVPGCSAACSRLLVMPRCCQGYYGANCTNIVNPCKNESASLCGANSFCVHTGPGTHECVCNFGYHKLGTACVRLNSCLIDNGGCDKTQDCIDQGTAEPKCQCKAGYEQHTNGKSCKLKNMCTPGLCGLFADCRTREPLKHSCICRGGYSWTGDACSGNIIERLKELSTQDKRFKNNIWYMRNMTSKIYDKLLTSHGPFTVLVPTDEAFRNALNDTELDELVNDDVKIKRILHQHMMAGQFIKSQLFSSSYNLQGNKAKFEIFEESYIEISGSQNTERSKIIAADLMASNGVIHVISDVMGLKENQFEDVKETAMDMIISQPEYSTLYSMIRAINLSEQFSQPNTTVLITNNTAWDLLSLHDKNYLTSDQDGLANLGLILKKHVFPGIIDVTDMITLWSINSSANIQFKVRVSQQGQIQLDNSVNIVRSDIPTRFGLCHQVDKVMVPSCLTPIMKNICEVADTQLVEGPCTRCIHMPCSQPTDVPTGQHTFCHHYDFGLRFRRNLFGPYGFNHPPGYLGGSWQHGFYRRYPFWSEFNERCSAICLRNIKKKACCDGFYGTSCIPCPGGFTNPCSGNGKCSAGKDGTGECSCNNNFSGTSCNQCTQNDTFGTSCNETCTCQFGQCDTGPKGTGKCKPRTCQLGYSGENCDKKLIPCDSDDVCQGISECFLGEDGSESCYCGPGYENNEDACLEIDLCADENNPCHQQATCSQDAPGTVNCTCNNGWHGDGFQCMPNYPCIGHNDCHKNAVCHNLVPGQHLCVCKTGYRGNGWACTLVDLCIERNGGCHPQAQCTFIKEGERNCTCPELMTGDGVTCRGTIAVEVMNHPRLTKLRDLMQVVNPPNMVLDTMNTTFTFLAPSDSVLSSFLESAKTQTTPDYWHQEENVLSFLNFHSLYNDLTTDDMLALDGVIRSYPTLYDGFSVRIVNTNKSLHIFANHSKFAVIREANIPAFNGYFHIIDQVLEPFFPDAQAPSLNDTLSLRPRYQLFYQALKKTNLLETVSSLNEYTLFVLSNKNFKQINRRVTADFLKYYVVPQLIFTPCIPDDDDVVVDTLLGSEHRLVLNKQDSNKIYVNDINIIRSDILTDGGVIHEVEFVMHPVLNQCDLNISTIDLGPCGDCMADDLACNEGFQSLGPEHIIKYKCHFHKNAGDEWETAGCQQICADYTSDTECCSGFYGYHCDECPGGAEIPCSGNGICDEGETGSGRCRCKPGFAGAACDRCQTTDLVPPFCNISYSSCEYMNGNCSDQAWCNETSSGITCQCFSGYVGDGHTCMNSCDGAENKGCHSQASCALNVSNQTLQCECNIGFHGNGTWCQQNSDPCTSQNGGCDLERAFCNFTQPKVTDMVEGGPVCECQGGYVGDGKLCSADLLDAISRIPDLSSFHSWLLAADKNGIINITGLFCDRIKQRTVFVSVTKLIDVTSFVIADGIFKLPDFSNTEGEVKSNVSNENSKMEDIKQWKLKSLNGQVINITLNDLGKYQVNGVRIVRENIEALNGVLHLTAAPLEDAGSLKSTTNEATFDSKLLINGVTVSVLVVVVVLLVIVIYKKRVYLCRHPPTSSHCNITFSKINSDESEDTVSIPDNTQYHNPLFANLNLQ